MSKKTNNEEIKAWKEKIYGIRQSADAAFNKLIVYLSSGALVLTIGFVKDLVDLKTAELKILLIAAWIFFIISLLSILISYLTTIKSMDFYLDEKKIESDKWDKKTILLNNASIAFLIFGIISFVIFVTLNF